MHPYNPDASLGAALSGDRSAAVAAQRRLLSLQIGISWATSGAGGSGRVFADLIGHLPDFGVDVLGAVSAPEDAAAQTAGRVISFAPKNASMLARLRGARKLIGELLAEKRPQLVASHFALYTAPALDRIGKTPLVVHFHGPWAAEAGEEGAGSATVGMKRALERFVYARADRVIVLSQAFAKIAMADYGIPEHKLRIIPGAVDIARFNVSQTRAEARLTLGWPSDKRIFVAVRRLVNRMGLDRLITAMKPVAAAYPDTVLYIIGKGRLRADLEQQVEAHDLAQHVKFLGFVPDDQLALAYRAADLNVVPTVALEGFGLVAVESLAAGTPSIVTPIGGLPEIIAPLSPGLVFQSSDPAHLSQGLLGAAGGEIRLPSAQECLAFASERFSVERMAAATAQAYRELLGA